MTEFRGVSASAGVAIGRVHVVDRRRLYVPQFRIAVKSRDAEVERLEKAVETTASQLEAHAARARDASLEQVEGLLLAHRMILRDEAFVGAARSKILNDGSNAEWAIKETVRTLAEAFEGLDEGYFRERGSDVDAVGARVMRNLVGAQTELIDHLSDDSIVCAYDLSPADTVALAKYAVRGFAVERGSAASHAAIVARALDIPCVVGCTGLLDAAASGDAVVIDGTHGIVHLRPVEEMLEDYEGRIDVQREERAALLSERELPAQTRDGTEIELLANLEMVSECDAVLQSGASGVGLFRTEFLFLEKPTLEGAQQHAEIYTTAVRNLEGRKLTIRTVDLGADKRFGADAHASGASPLGLRAIRASLRDVQTLRDQLEGVARAAAAGPVELLLPFLSELPELRIVSTLLDEVVQVLNDSGVPAQRPPLGVMIETPSAVFLADHFARESDFLSIGSNDLLQYGMAADRGDSEVAYLCRPTQPSVFRMIAHVVEAARAANVPVCLCGELAASARIVPVILGLGVRCLSMRPSAIAPIKRVVRAQSISGCQALANQVLDCSDADQVDALLRNR